MRDVLIGSMPVMLWVLTVLNGLFLGLLLSMYRKNPEKKLSLIMALVVFGLFYDSLMLALGTVLPAGGLLKSLSLFRFVFHCALIPLTFVICADALGFGAKAKKVVWILTGIVIVIGIAAGFATVLSPAQVGNVVRYASDKTLTPGWSEGIQNGLSFGPVVILMICGIIAWVKRKNPHLFLAGFLMFVFAALGPATGNFDLIFYISMFGELFMTLFFWLYAKKEEK